ncbi:MAG: hypothetical protein IKM66_08075 [Clostridia bacterium]|nr:hypothetical protein [Clostridia bacterium]
MKKSLSLILSFFIILSLCITSSAYYFFDDAKNDFICTDKALYLTAEKKAGEIDYFGERFTITDKDGNKLSAEDYISSGCTLNYFEKFDIFKIILVGDINCDGHITAADARIALRMSARLYSPGEDPDKYGAFDANYSGTIEAADAREILRAAAQISEYNLFKEKIADKIYSEESIVPSNRNHYSVGVILHPDFLGNPDCLNADFFGKHVKNVESISEMELELILTEPTYDNAIKLYQELKNNDAVILSTICF